LSDERNSNSLKRLTTSGVSLLGHFGYKPQIGPTLCALDAAGGSFMRARTASALAIVLVLCASSAGETAFPYLVSVATDGASLRSGPGEDYYKTALATRGSELEVWRHAPDGWLAVRPPAGSFSLVSAADVRVQADRMADAVRPGVPVRVGSEVAMNPDVVQVLLNAGERVQVLQTVPLDGQFWHRIAPPSGEFRWIHCRDVAGPNLPAAPLVSQATSSPPAEPTAAETSPPASRESYRIAPFSPAAEASCRVAQAEALAMQESLAGLAGQTLADLVGGPAVDARPGGVTPADIEVELATIVAEDPRLWQFAQLRTKCEELARAADAATQEQCEAILEKIARFERIRDMRHSIASRRPVATSDQPAATWHVQTADDDARVEIDRQHDISSTVDGADAWQAVRELDQRRQVDPVAKRGEVARTPEEAAAAAEGRYDGIGTLRPVVSRRRDAPRYALVDETGDVVTFITPSPGVNLQPYVGERLGVVGTRGYMPEFKRAHITAARVTPLRR
jgi:hypothetical protein